MIGRFVVWLFLLSSCEVCWSLRRFPFTRLSAGELVHLNRTCGRLRAEGQFKIFGGERAETNEFPWAAKIIVRNRDEEELRECTGTFISRRHVITAAHCLEYDKYGDLVGGEPSTHYFVMAGSACLYESTDRFPLEECEDDTGKTIKGRGARLFEVRAVVVPETSQQQRAKYMRKQGFDFSHPFSDIAILELKFRVNSTGPIVPVCLWPAQKTPPDGPNRELPIYVFLGYGSYERSQSLNAMLHLVKLQPITKEECERNIRFRPTGCDRILITYRDFSQHQASACYGDDGAGVIYEQTEPEEISFLYAVLSTGLSACDPENMDKQVFSEASTIVGSHHDFICFYTGICNVEGGRYLRADYETKPDRAFVLDQNSAANSFEIADVFDVAAARPTKLKYPTTQPPPTEPTRKIAPGLLTSDTRTRLLLTALDGAALLFFAR